MIVSSERIEQASDLVVRRETSQTVPASVTEEEEMLEANNTMDNHRIIHRNNKMDRQMQDDHVHNIDNHDTQEIPRKNRIDSS